MKKVVLSLLLAIACVPMAFGQSKRLVTTDTTVCSKFLWTVNNVEYDSSTTVVYQEPGDTTNTVYVLHLTMLERNYDTVNVRAKEGNCMVYWNHKTWTEEGTFFDTITPAVGCDTIIRISITLNGIDTVWQTATGCDQYIFHGDTLTTSGDHFVVDSATATTDCHVYGVHLTINHSYTDSAAAVVEDITGGCRVEWMGHTYTIGDTNQTFYHMGATAVSHCDSLMAIRITSFTGIQNDTLRVNNCGKYTWSVTNQTYETEGSYAHSDTTADCIDNKVLVLHFISAHDTVNTEACLSVVDGDKYAYIFEARSGQAMRKDTAYYDSTDYYTVDHRGDTLYSVHYATRCKTYHTLHLSVIAPAQRILDMGDTSICDQLSFNFMGSTRTIDHTVDTSIVYSRRTVASCYDTIAHVNVTVRHKSYKDYNETTCDSYYWPFTGETYTASTTETKVLDDVKNSENCDSVGRLRLTVHYTPEVSIVGDWHIQPGETAHLKAVYDASDRNTFQWYKNNTAIPASQGGTRDSLEVTGTGNVDIRLETTSHPSGSTHTCMATNWITVTFNVGIDDVEGLQVNLYPNPASRFVNVESSDVISEVEVYNALGQQLIRRSVNANATQLDLQSLAIGHYTLRILAADGSQTTRKFIVNK